MGDAASRQRCELKLEFGVQRCERGKVEQIRRKRVADINILALQRRGKNSLGEAGQPISYFIWPSVEGETAPIQLRQDEWRWRFAFLGKPIMTYPLLSCRCR